MAHAGYIEKSVARLGADPPEPEIEDEEAPPQLKRLGSSVHW